MTRVFGLGVVCLFVCGFFVLVIKKYFFTVVLVLYVAKDPLENKMGSSLGVTPNKDFLNETQAILQPLSPS